MDTCWHSRGYLPHFHAGRELQMITYRLADSLPAQACQRLARELTPDAEPAYRKRMERLLDQHHGGCALRDPAMAAMVIDNWRHFDGVRYRLLAWVVMPNHVHVLIELLGTASVARIVQSWKSYTGRRLMAAAQVGWQREYWDRWIRDEAHFLAARDYIHANPRQAGLCRADADWQWSSAWRGNGD